MDSTHDRQDQPVEGVNADAPVRQAAALAVGAPLKRKPGPKKAASKAKIRFNAVRTGLHAVTPVIPGLEREEDWRAHRDGIVASCAPVGALELKLAERIAYLLWRLDRVVAADHAEYLRVNRGSREMKLPPATELDKIMRSEAHLHRQFIQTQHELEALQKRRLGQPAPLARLDIDLQAG